MADTTWATQINEVAISCPSLYIVTDSSWKTPDGLTWGADNSHVVNDLIKRNPPTQWMSLKETCEWYASNDLIQEPDTFLHAYSHPIIAMLLHRTHDNFDQFELWECNGFVKYTTIDKMAYCTELKSLRSLHKPVISSYTRMKFGFGCVDKVYKDKVFLDWILDWVGSNNRSKEKANEIAEYCSSKAKEEQKKEDVDYDKLRLLFAAQWMCMAAVAYDSLMEENADKLVEYWAGLAAVESAQAAYALKIPDFDLITIAELTMVAR